MAEKLIIHDAHGWSQADRRALVLRLCAQMCAAGGYTYTEIPDGVQLYRQGVLDSTVTYAELVAIEQAYEARWRGEGAAHDGE
jgi:hypothetical protein